jgi:hypothetical protein
MIRWGGLALIGVLLASALLLRRWPLAALAVTLGGAVVTGVAMAIGVSLLIPLVGVPSVGSVRVGSAGPAVSTVTIAVSAVTIIAWPDRTFHPAGADPD